MRLDEYLVQQGLAPSRSQAADYIRRGEVTVGSKVVAKPAYEVKVGETPQLASRERFVGRGGEKLAAALAAFSIDPKGLVVLDVGSSTGGFTDCLLSRGAALVVAVDVGTGQLAERLRANPRIELHESTDIRAYNDTRTFALIVIDVSFISLVHIVPKVTALAAPNAEVVVLVKPQFEVGKGIADKDGVVRDEVAKAKSLENAKSTFVNAGFLIKGEMRSPIEGGSGNEEWLLYLRKVS